MKQQTLATAAGQGGGFETNCKCARRNELLDTMNAIVPWAELCSVVEPHYPKRGNSRPPIGLERIMRAPYEYVCKISTVSQNGSFLTGSIKCRDQTIQCCA